MDWGFALQLAGSAIAVAALVALAAWARLARPTPPLDEAAARALLAEEFPDHEVQRVWIDEAAAGLIARSDDEALVIWRRGDGYVARSMPWAAAIASPGQVDGAPRLRISPWPPASDIA